MELYIAYYGFLNGFISNCYCCPLSLLLGGGDSFY